MSFRVIDSSISIPITGLVWIEKGVFSLAFNSFTFLFFLVSALGIKADNLEHSVMAGLPLVWIILTAVGVTLIIYGCIAIGKIIVKICAPKEQV